MYANFIDAYNARIAYGTGFAIIQIDDTLSGCFIAAGDYNLFNTKLLGILPMAVGTFVTAFTNLAIADGVTFNGSALQDVENLNLLCTNNNALQSPSGTGQVLMLRNATVQTYSGTGTFWTATGSGIVLILYDGSQFLMTGGVTMDATSALQVFDTEGSTMGPGTIVGPAGSSVSLTQDASSVFSRTQPGFLGSYTTPVLLDQAPLVVYSPAVPANWVTPPVQVAQALDELAAKTGSGSVIGFGPYASRPVTPGAAGNLYIVNPGPVTFVSDGTNWDPLLDGVVGTQPPAAASWSNYGGVLSNSDLNGTLIVEIPDSPAAPNLFGKTQPLPGATYFMTAGFKYFPHPAGGSYGLMISDGTQAIYFSLTYLPTGICTLSVVQYTTATTPGTTTFTMNLPGGISGGRFWLNLSQGGGIRTYKVIVDGSNTNETVHEESAGTFLTETVGGQAMTCGATSVTTGQVNLADLQSFAILA